MGIKEGDIVLHPALYPTRDYLEAMPKSKKSLFFCYGCDPYALLEEGEKVFYSYKSHRWYLINHQLEKQIDARFMSYKIQRIPKQNLTFDKAKELYQKYELEFRKDYAKTGEKFYRLKGDFIYKHDEKEDKYMMYLYSQGWISIDWKHKNLSSKDFFEDLIWVALRITSTEAEDLIQKFENRPPKILKRANEVNLLQAGIIDENCDDIQYSVIFDATVYKYFPQCGIIYTWQYGWGWQLMFGKDIMRYASAAKQITKEEAEGIIDKEEKRYAKTHEQANIHFYK